MFSKESERLFVLGFCIEEKLGSIILTALLSSHLSHTSQIKKLQQESPESGLSIITRQNTHISQLISQSSQIKKKPTSLRGKKLPGYNGKCFDPSTTSTLWACGCRFTFRPHDTSPEQADPQSGQWQLLGATQMCWHSRVPPVLLT